MELNTLYPHKVFLNDNRCMYLKDDHSPSGMFRLSSLSGVQIHSWDFLDSLCLSSARLISITELLVLSCSLKGCLSSKQFRLSGFELCFTGRHGVKQCGLPPGVPIFHYIVPVNRVKSSSSLI